MRHVLGFDSGGTVHENVMLAVSRTFSDMCEGSACCAQSDSESGGSTASSARSPIVPAAAAAVLLPTSSLRASSMLIPKLDVDEAPRDCGDQAADADSLHRSAESGFSTADSALTSQRQGSRALSAMEGATFAIGKMQAVHRPSQVMGASCSDREQLKWQYDLHDASVGICVDCVACRGVRLSRSHGLSH